MANTVSDFDRGALGVFHLMAQLRGQLQEFAQELRQTWPWRAVSWGLECGANADSGFIGIPIELWLELEVDPERTVCWSLILCQQDQEWEIDTGVELYDMTKDENADRTFIDLESKPFDSFELARKEMPELLTQLFATREEVETRLKATKRGA